MNALFRWLDVDRVQWRALLRASLRTDFAALRRSQGGSSKRPSSALGLTLLIYLVAGISPAVVAARVPDTLLSTTILVTVVGFMVVSSLLIGEGTSILSPGDLQVLGFRPVTSRTYFAVRVTSLLVRTAIISTCVALVPVAVFLARGGFHPSRGSAALIASYAGALGVTLALVAIYGWLLRLAGPRRMMRYASYTQFAVQFIVWGGFIVVTQELFTEQLAGASLSGSPWSLLYPGAWFASYVPIADGDLAWRRLLPAALSILLVLVLGRAIGGKLALGYADSLGRLAATVAKPGARTARPARWTRLLDDESRAMAILVRSHMQHDIKFRLGVISLIPITLMYILMGGWPTDPFVDGVPRGGETPVIMMALLFLPVTLRRVLVTSERWRASWIFLAAPSNHAKLVLAARNIISLFFLLPYLLFIAALFAYSFGDPAHAVLHATFMGLVSYLVLQFIVLVHPQLPFSLPAEKDAQSGAMFGIMMVVILVGMGLYYLLTLVVYRSTMAMAAGGLVFVALAWTMDRMTRRRARQMLAEAGEGARS